MKKFKNSVFLIIVFSFFTSSFAVNKSAVIQSTLIPGMGQMNSGGNNTYIGLGIMFAEALALHGVFTEMGKTSSYQKQTAIYADEIKWATSYNKKMEIINNWDESYNNAKDSKTKMTLWMVAAGGIWVLNIVETAFFIPDKEEVSIKHNNKIPLFGINSKSDGLELSLTKNF